MTTPDANIVIIMGESLHREYMSMYGYNINTTPYLDELKKDENFFYKKELDQA